MKKRLLLILFAFLAVSVSMNAQNLVVNGDFETGDKTGWDAGWGETYVEADPSPVFQGLYSGKIRAGANWIQGSFAQDVAVIPGHSYDVSFTAIQPDGTSWGPGIAMVVKDDASGTIIGKTDYATSTEWQTVSKQITVPAGVDTIQFDLYRGKKLPVIYLDSVSIIDRGAIHPALTVTFDGEISEGAEDGEEITVSMINDVFAATLDAANWTLSFLPEGVSVSVTRVNDTAAVITLTGNATVDYDGSMTSYLTIAAAEFVTETEDVAAGMSVAFTGFDEPTPTLTMKSDGEILEDFEDGEMITVSIELDSFVTTLTQANWALTGLPEGVSLGSLERVNDTAVIITLAGNTTGDYDNDITDAALTVEFAELKRFNEPVTVNSGITFTAAVEGAEVLLWEETFDTYADGMNLLDTIGGNDYGLNWENYDSAMVYGGVLQAHPHHLDAWDAAGSHHRIGHQYPVEPGKTYKATIDSKTAEPGYENVFSVLTGEGSDFKTDPSTSTTMRTRSVIVEPTLPDHDTANVTIYLWGWDIPDVVLHIDKMSLFVLTEPKISVSSDGEILEGSEDGEVITVTLGNDTFVATPDAANWSFSVLPAGVTIGSLNRIDDTTIELVLSGNASEDYDEDLIATITGTREEFVISNKNLTDGDITFKATVEPPTIELADDGEIKEGAEDAEIITVTLSLDTFVDPIDPTNWTVTNLPAGVSVGGIYRIDSVTVEFDLAGNTTEDYDEDITNLTVSVKAAELSTYNEDLTADEGVTFIANIEDAIDLSSIHGLMIFPNPVADNLSVSAQSMILKVEIYNMLGEKIQVVNDLNASLVNIDTKQWSAGVYFIGVTDNDGNHALSKVVK